MFSGDSFGFKRLIRILNSNVCLYSQENVYLTLQFVSNKELI